jgi:hypothetical protein
MTCQESEEAIALLVDGEPAASGLAEHLVDCGACRHLMQDLRVDQAALREIPAEDPAACEALRNDVMRRVGRGSRTVGRWFAEAGAIAAGLAIVGILVRMPGPTKLMPETNEHALRRVEDKDVGTKADAAALKARSSGRRRGPGRAARDIELAMDSEWGRILSASPEIDERPARRGSTSEVAMRIRTGDPQVVILWLKEEVQGGSNE